MYSICIVDDREIFRRQFKRFALFRSNEDFQVKYEAQNGQEAMEILRSTSVDMVITDIRMPIMDGLELLKTAKEEKLCSCIVLLSEYSDFAYAKQGIVLGAFDYLVKPLDMGMLRDLLERAKEYLRSRAQGIAQSNSEMRILPGLILKNDSYAEVVGKQIAEKILLLETDADGLYLRLNEVLHQLREKVEPDLSYMEKYCCFDELFLLKPIQNGDSWVDVFVEKIREIRMSVNKFFVSTKNELILSVINLIVRNIEDNLSLQSVAKLLFVNKAYLSHLFKQELGIGFTDYLVSVKIERAKYLLGYSQMKIYEISTQLGYSDTEYFSRIFKQITGKKPTEYREMFFGGDAG